MILAEENWLAHYGILRRSGRYPWGSGGNVTQRSRSFLDVVDGLRRQGLSDVDIAKGFHTPEHPFTTTQLRALKSIAKNEKKQADIAMAERLKAKGLSNIAIGERMGIRESSVRALLDPGQKSRVDVLVSTSNMLKEQVAKKAYVDVGVGVERHLGISQTKLNTAIARLQEEGYTLHYVKVEQLGTGQQTTIKVLAAPEVGYGQVYKNRGNIKQITEHTEDGGRTYFGILPPTSVKSSRVHVRYADEGGADADGVIYVRPGAASVSLGGARYAQVRIAVNGTHYIKGMAMYKDDLPDGVDLVVNVNKKNTGNKLDAFKELKDDPDNPFGAVISRQITKTGKDGKQKVTSAMNIVNEEADWDSWSRSISSQILSKQSPALARTQLDMTYERRKTELDEIMSLTNPGVRRKLLEGFADGADSAAVHLKAHQLPKQKSHVLLPFSSIKEGEIYAPNYDNGTRVALIRHPHGGIFEIPELTVNNKNREARKTLGNATAAVGINHKVAHRLSGADFDGDTVLVIPNDRGTIKTAPALAGLKGFDPQAAYPGYPGMTKMTARTKALEMGDVSNLITDMTIRGASSAELARAVRHSMVVIDAEKHGLNYKESARVNGIPQLKEKYQGGARAGASTLISRAKRDVRVLERKPNFRVDPATGKKVYKLTGATRPGPRGTVIPRTTRSKELAEVADARKLSSGTKIEEIYAEHSNKLKALANTARRAAVTTRTTPYSSSAKTAYQREVASLNAKLNTALKNAPLERQAQVLANAVVSQKRRANPDLEPSEIKRMKAQALTEQRIRTGAKKTRITITDSEWAAIQAGAISNDKLSKILNNSDLDQIKALAAPKSKILMTSTKQRRAQAMIASGYTQAEVADALGVSLTTLKDSLAS